MQALQRFFVLTFGEQLPGAIDRLARSNLARASLRLGALLLQPLLLGTLAGNFSNRGVQRLPQLYVLRVQVERGAKLLYGLITAALGQKFARFSDRKFRGFAPGVRFSFGLLSRDSLPFQPFTFQPLPLQPLLLGTLAGNFCNRGVERHAQIGVIGIPFQRRTKPLHRFVIPALRRELLRFLHRQQGRFP